MDTLEDLFSMEDDEEDEEVSDDSSSSSCPAIGEDWNEEAQREVYHRPGTSRRDKYIPLLSGSEAEEDKNTIVSEDDEDADLYMSKVEKLSIPKRRPWYSDENKVTYDILFESLESCANILQDKHNTLSRSSLIRIHSGFYRIIMCLLVILSDPLPEAENDADNGAFTKLYIVCAMAMLQLGKPKSCSVPSKSNPFCVRYRLCTSHTSIENYNIDELICSLTVLERNWRNLPYHEGLCVYLDALEWRICDILTNALSDQTHNIAELRTEYKIHKESGKMLYVFNSEAEYNFSVRIIALRQELSTCMLECRMPLNKLTSKMPEFNEDLVEIVTCNLAYSMFKMHSDYINNAFSSQYYNMSVSKSEAYIFLKKHPTQTEVIPQDAISELRSSVGEWRRIGSKARGDITMAILNTDDPLSCMIAVYLIMQELLMQCTERSWRDYVVPQYSLENISDMERDSILQRSLKTPLFMHSMNEACIMWKKRMYVVGASGKDYMRALTLWLVLVCSKNYSANLPFVSSTLQLYRCLLVNNISREQLLSRINVEYNESLSEKLGMTTFGDLMNAGDDSTTQLQKRLSEKASTSAWIRRSKKTPNKRKRAPSQKGKNHYPFEDQRDTSDEDSYSGITDKDFCYSTMSYLHKTHYRD